jgi:hypothetical protein
MGLKPSARRHQVPDQAATFTESALVQIPGREKGGNHKHPRIELFTALTEGLELVFMDEQGLTRTLLMNTAHNEPELTFYLLPPHLPHAVNNTAPGPGYLLEFASGPQQDVEPVALI